MQQKYLLIFSICLIGLCVSQQTRQQNKSKLNEYEKYKQIDTIEQPDQEVGDLIKEDVENLIAQNENNEQQEKDKSTNEWIDKYSKTENGESGKCFAKMISDCRQSKKLCIEYLLDQMTCIANQCQLQIPQAQDYKDCVVQQCLSHQQVNNKTMTNKRFQIIKIITMKKCLLMRSNQNIYDSDNDNLIEESEEKYQEDIENLIDDYSKAENGENGICYAKMVSDCSFQSTRCKETLIVQTQCIAKTCLLQVLEAEQFKTCIENQCKTELGELQQFNQEAYVCLQQAQEQQNNNNQKIGQHEINQDENDNSSEAVIAELKSQIVELEKTNLDLENKQINYQQETKKLQEIIKEFKLTDTIIAELKSKIIELEKTNLDLENQLINYQQENKKLDEIIKEYKLTDTIIAELKSKIIELEKTNLDLENKQINYQQETEKLDEIIKEFKLSDTILKQRAQVQENTIEDLQKLLQKQLNENQKIYSQMFNELDIYKQGRKKMEERIAEFKQSDFSLRQKINEQEKSIKDLENQLQIHIQKQNIQSMQDLFLNNQQENQKQEIVMQQSNKPEQEVVEQKNIQPQIQNQLQQIFLKIYILLVV
ncbi:hypothetical protein ABPG74_012087 [Tetrahymena malaccensis]